MTAKLLPVIATNRLESLQQGKIDVIIAAMSDKPERRQVVEAVEPLYYADPVNVLATKRANRAHRLFLAHARGAQGGRELTSGAWSAGGR